MRRSTVVSIYRVYFGEARWEPPLNAVLLAFYCRHDIQSPWEIMAKIKQCPTLHCYVLCKACCYVPPQTLMKVSFMCGRGIRAKIQTFGLSPKLRAPPHDSSFMVSQGSPRELGRAWTWLGPLCVYCKLVGESRSRRAKKQREQRQFDENQQKYG